MATNKLQWRRIAKGDKLPCQSFLRKKNGEILKLSTGAGVTVGQDAYYLPVDDVINVIKDYPAEESEDGKIRKALVEMVHDTVGDSLWVDYNVHKEDAIAWLEKQGENQNNVYDKELSEILGCVICRYINDPNIPYTEREKVSMEIIPYVEKLEKQGEQQDVSLQINPSEYINDMGGNGCYLKNTLKPVDKIEPKFKVDDWVVYDHRAYQVVALPKEGYINLGLRENGKFEFAPYTYCRHWSIEDAKDGDILYECNEKKPFIFKELKTKHIGDIASYCDIFNGIFNPNEDDWTTLDIVPATKEQCDILFSKMKEAGYEWDAENKQLRKIEQETAWSEEDERLCQCLIQDQEEALDKVSNDKYGHSEIVSDLEEMYKERISWLKSLKDRVQPQPKQWWSEEDEKMINFIVKLLPAQPLSCKWLKSLKDRYTWKPSDEQMERLKGTINSLPHQEVLYSLYQDLKKLKD